MLERKGRLFVGGGGGGGADEMSRGRKRREEKSRKLCERGHIPIVGTRPYGIVVDVERRRYPVSLLSGTRE